MLKAIRIMTSRNAGPASWSVSCRKPVWRERPPDNLEIRKAMQEIAAVRRRFGYRRIGLLLERRG